MSKSALAKKAPKKKAPAKKAAPKTSAPKKTRAKKNPKFASKPQSFSITKREEDIITEFGYTIRKKLDIRRRATHSFSLKVALRMAADHLNDENLIRKYCAEVATEDSRGKH